MCKNTNVHTNYFNALHCKVHKCSQEKQKLESNEHNNQIHPCKLTLSVITAGNFLHIFL